MLACKRSNYWMCKEAVTFAVIISLSLTLFYMLRLELRERNGEFDPREKYGSRYNMLEATSLRTDVPRNIYTQHTQFKDFEGRIEHTTDAQLSHTEVTQSAQQNNNLCRKLNNCFNFDRCISGFNIYLHPFTNNQFISSMYGQILEAIKNNIYITNDPSKACLFILSLDTLDRDKLSTNYMKDLHKKVSQQTYWNGGENHLILNMFSGTWPDYSDDLSFDYGKAIIAKASFSEQSFRFNYDVSIPLLPKNFPLTNNLTNINKNVNLFPIRRKYLLVFKGKRYLHGIGSESRNNFYLINNDKDIILLTSCRHNGKEWEKMKDEHCDSDNEKYDRYDYDDLMSNSTFCLVPRGRRLGSFRLFEAIERGCIPVIISNGWTLPYSGVIDWSRFAVVVDEHLLLQIPSIVRSFSNEEILARRQQTLFVWKKYFSSIEKVIHTMIEVLRERIEPNLKRQYLLWNMSPGALKVDPMFSPSPLHYPFYVNMMNVQPIQRFTAVIVAVSPVYRSSSPLFHLIKSINLSDYLDQILVVWLPLVGMPDKSRWPRTKVTLRVIHPPKKDMNAKYNHMGLVKTDAIFTFNENVSIDKSEIDFAFSVWCSNPSQMVGFSTGIHFFNNNTDIPGWDFTSGLTNEFSTIDTGSAIFHRYYSHYFTTLSPAGLHQLVEREKSCESVAMNFIVNSISGKPPIKVARSQQFKDGLFPRNDDEGFFSMRNHDETKRQCLVELISIFKDLPLDASKLSFNPILFRDPVSIGRKKYRTLG